jgi:hypothetical protein
MSTRLDHEGAPLGQCGRASLLVDLWSNEMPFLIEVVNDLRARGLSRTDQRSGWSKRRRAIFCLSPRFDRPTPYFLVLGLPPSARLRRPGA